MMTYRVGACASPSSGKAMAEYYLAGTLKTEPARAAEYYTGAEAREDRAAEFWRGAAGGTVAELRPDLSPALAARLGIADPGRPLTQAGIANLLNATRLDGEAITGRKKHTATRSVAELFGLDPKQPASAEAIGNVLAGKRADGGMPQNAAGKALPAAVVEGARKRFKAALGLPVHREATADELEHLENGRLATGRLIDMADYRRQIHATRPPVGFVDMTFSADKSLSVAWVSGADCGGTLRPPRYSPERRRRHDGLRRDPARFCQQQSRGSLCGRARHFGMDQLPALHRAAGRRYRAARQARAGLHGYPRGAVADGGPAASYPRDGVQQRADGQRAYRRHRSRPAGRAGQGAGCSLPCQYRGPGPATRHRDHARPAHRCGAARRYPAFGARGVQQADDRSAAGGARVCAAQGDRLGRDHRRAEDCLVEGRGGGNPAG